MDKTFQRRKLLKAVEGKGDGAATLAKILKLMSAGDARMEQGDCEAARASYQRAQSQARASKFADDVTTIIEWKIFKADACLGAAVLPLPGPEVEDSTCGIKALGDGEIMSDFQVAAQPDGFRRILHWGKWFDLFGLHAQ